MIHIMGDLETLGTKPGAAILQIGAVKFDSTTILDRFNVAISAESNGNNGMQFDGATIDYWLNPERDAARALWWELPKLTLFEACMGFTEWVEETPPDKQGSFWGKGAGFDSPLLQAAYAKLGAVWPFSYRQDECFRTMELRCPGVPRPPFKGMPHYAADDAENQAVHLQMICAHLGLEL